MGVPLSSEARAELDRVDRLVGLGKYREALVGLKNLSAAYPAHGAIAFLHARALTRLGERARAGEVLAHAQRLAPEDPHVGLGLAQIAVEAGDLERAVALSRPAREVPALRGEALALAALERESARDDEGARALYVASYVARPTLDVLAACERLSTITPPASEPAPWPIGVVQRRWLFGALEAELATRARARFGELPPEKLLTAGCDHGASLTARWAERAGVERITLFRALADRGGFCDCEVCLNAARGDDDDVSVLLVAGRAEGGIPEGSALEGFFAREKVGAPTLSDSPERDREERARDGAFAVELTARGVEIPPQLVTDGLVADLAETMTNEAGASLALTLVVLAPDLLDRALRPAAELVSIRDGRLTALPLGFPLSSELRSALPWLASALASLERSLPPRVSGPSPARWALDTPQPQHPALLARGETGVWIDLDGAAPSREVPATLVLARGGAHAAWLRTRRTRSELVLADRARAEQVVLATDRFRGTPWIEADGSSVIAAAGGEIVELDARTFARRVLARGDAFAVSEDGRRLAIARDRGEAMVIVDRRGGVLFGPFSGRAPQLSPRGDRLAYLARDAVRPEGTSYEMRVLELGDNTHRRVGPIHQEASWPSFAFEGRALVFQARVARRWIPLEDGRARLEDDERLFLVDLDAGDEVRELYATHGGSMRIVSPLAHPRHARVVFRTRDAPRVGDRLVSVGTDGTAVETLIRSAPLTPLRWLG